MIDLRNVTDPDEIVAILADAAEAYENDGDSELTDAEYDALELQLRKLDPTNSFLTAVGSDVRGGKIPLPFKMGSLDQVYEGETAKWISDNNWGNETFVVTNKEDGTSGLLVYDRDLKIAYSRGNGILGADITRHVSRIKQVPKKIKGKATIRVEVIMEDEVFDSLKQKATDAGERVYKTARNYVAGRMNASESPQEFYDNVRVIATSVVEPEMSKSDQIQFLIANGFDVPEFSIVDGLTLTDEYLTVDLNERREQSRTAIDGLVIDLNDADLRANLTRKSSSINPMYAKKFKVGEASNQANATVVQVHYEPSKTGYLKPRIEIEPVDLTGVTIRFASGFNAAFIRDNGIGPGAIVKITRAGDVIPTILETISPMPTDDLILG